MPYHHVIRGERFAFADLREVFAKANEEKSGDQLAGLAAESDRERVAAKCVLADLRVAEVVDRPLIDPDTDEVSRLFLDGLSAEALSPWRSLTLGELRRKGVIEIDRRRIVVLDREALKARI